MNEVQITYTGWLRDRIGHDDERVPLDAGVPLVQLIDRVRVQGQPHHGALADCSRLRAAINSQIVPWSTLVNPGDELLLFTPLTGG